MTEHQTDLNDAACVYADVTRLIGIKRTEIEHHQQQVDDLREELSVLEQQQMEARKFLLHTTKDYCPK